MKQRSMGWGWCLLVAQFVVVEGMWGAPVVTGFTPGTGVPGVQVTVQGSGFTGATKVQFNNTAADFRVVSASQLVATLPVEATVGPVRVFVDGVAGDSGLKHFLPSPRLTGMTPGRGAVGTTVVLEGSNFAGVSEVRFGEETAVFSVPASDQIRVAVPAGLSLTNPVPVTVTTLAGSVVSEGLFTLTGPAPIVDSFEPVFGAPGTSVAIYGANFTNVTGVTFGGVAAASFSAPTPARLNVVVPAGAVTGSLRVTTGGGVVTSAGSFQVTLLPVITNFFPVMGKPGTAVTLEGVNFTGVKNVWFGGVQVTGWGTPAPGQITTTVPQGAVTSKLTVQNTAGNGQSAVDFVVPVAPVILEVLPLEGQVGVTSVYISGFNLVGSTLWFNGVQAAYTPSTQVPEGIRATVPFGATTGPLSMTNAAGGFVTAGDFSVYGDDPFVRGFEPAFAPRGAEVRIRGGNFYPPVSVKFDGVLAPGAAAVAPGEIVVTVPAAATSGLVEVVTPNGTALSEEVFHVPPRLGSLVPASGAEGAQVRLQGVNLGQAVSVDFGGVSAVFEPENPDLGEVLVAVVPAGVVTGKPVRVVTPGGVVISEQVFGVLPKITVMEPGLGPVGTPVVLRGTSFVGVGGVSFNGRAAGFTVVSTSEIHTAVPLSVGVGPGNVVVATTQGNAQGPVPFYITSSTDLQLAGGPTGVLLEPGEEVQFSYSLLNRGSSPATGVTVVETVPVGFEILSAESSIGSWEVTGGQVLFDVGVLTNGVGATMSTTARAVSVGGWTNHVLAVASMAEPDWDPSNHRVVASLVVTDDAALELGVRAVGGEELAVVLEWPASGVPLVLETTGGLGDGPVWGPVGEIPVLSGGVYRVTNRVEGGSGYYRLRLIAP
jgi:uncharacterized repeat protein (TIGR01451 family)